VSRRTHSIHRKFPILALTALTTFLLCGALWAFPETAQASSPLPPAVTADGTAWQTFVTNGLSAIASHDGSSTASISDVGPIYSGSLVFKTGPNAGSSFPNQTLAGLTTDSSGADMTTFTMLNNTSGLIERYSNCQADAGSTGPSTTGTCQVTQYDLGSYSSSSITSVDTVSRAYSQTAEATSGGSAAPAGDPTCTSAAYAPGTEGSIYGPLITYGGTLYCNAPENLSVIDGLYNDSSDGYIGTGYSTGASGNGVYSVTASGLAPCDSPYSPGDYFETAQLAYVNGSLFGGNEAYSALPCAEISYPA
jgi:hypothetical protein